MKYRLYQVEREDPHYIREDDWEEFEKELEKIGEEIWTIEKEFENWDEVMSYNNKLKNNKER